MKVINPTDETVAILYKGVNYEIEANGSAEMPDDVAKYWRDRIHNFLKLSESKEVKEEDKPTYSTEEVPEEVLEEISDKSAKKTDTKKSTTKKTNK